MKNNFTNENSMFDTTSVIIDKKHPDNIKKIKQSFGKKESFLSKFSLRNLKIFN